MSHILRGKQNKAHGTIQEYFKMSHQPTKTFHTYEIIELRKRKLRLKLYTRSLTLLHQQGPYMDPLT